MDTATNIPNIVEDTRPIESVQMPGEGGERWHVGRHRNVTKIKAYWENGQGAYVPWLAIYVGDAIAHRINCAVVEYISY